MNKQQLAAKIWESANKMRSKIEANEYKDYILGFIFYKFLSDQEVKYLKANDWMDEDLPDLKEEDTTGIVEDMQRNKGYFIAYEHLFSTWIAQGSDFSADKVTSALSAFSRLIGSHYKKVFGGIFTTLETGLSKLGETSGARTKAIRDLLYLIKDIPMDGRQDYDVLGFIYEYLISNFAANAGKKAGEFYTPHEVSLLMSEIVAHHLQHRAEIKIYDPTSGSGSLLINIGQCVAKYMSEDNRIKYYAQELKENTYNLTRMNLIMRGILPDNLVTRNGDTLEEDWPDFDENDPIKSYVPLYVDAVVSNPPYSQVWNPTDKGSDPRYANFGLAPKGKADYAFLLHDLFHLKPDGIMTIVLPHGVLFRGGEEGNIRKNLIENNHIDAIIGLPANIFFGTGIPTIIMVLRQSRPNTDVLIIDASKGFDKVGKNNVLRARDIKRVVDTLTARTSCEHYAKQVSRDEIRANDYNLNIPRYVDASETPESWDIYAAMFGGIPATELDTLNAYWAAFPTLREALFQVTTAGYCSLRTQTLKATLQAHPDVCHFLSHYTAAFQDFEAFLTAELITQWKTIDLSKEEARLSESVFARLATCPLVDRYEAYQLLHDDWKSISADLEMIQQEGFEATRKVDPLYVLKKKNGRDEEIQEGWVGHLLPFDLVQTICLPNELAALKALTSQLTDLTASYETYLEELDEEVKEEEAGREDGFINETKEAFVPAGVKKALKAHTVDEATFAILKKVNALILQEKTLKKALKEATDHLHLLTKKTIETLSDETVLKLLNAKWIQPLMTRLLELPQTVIATFTAQLDALCTKYDVTYAHVEEEIKTTGNELATMLSELTGSPQDLEGLAELANLLRGE